MIDDTHPLAPLAELLARRPRGMDVALEELGVPYKVVAAPGTESTEDLFDPAAFAGSGVELVRLGRPAG